MEIAPLSVRELVLDERWRFEPPYAADVVTLPDKVWFVKKSIRQQIPFNAATTPFDSSRYDLPEGFRLFKGVSARADLDYAYADLTRLFYDYDRARAAGRSLPRALLSSDQSYRGLVYLFTGDGGVTQYYPRTQRFLSRWYPAASKLVEAYARELADIYEVPERARAEFFADYLQVIVLRYEPNAGIWLHIDNVARYDQAPIATVSVGPPRVYYDMTPTLCPGDTRVPVRVEFGEGDLAIMGGSARMEWAHGLPSYVPASKTKYSILFKFDCFGAVSKTYNEILDDYVVTSGKWPA
jgi:alkylated DNA repair dioxygenase AlkB